MAFTHDTNTDEGKLRTLLNDSDSTSYEWEDDELTSMLELNSSDLHDAAADLCMAAAAKYAKEAQIVGLGKQDIYLDKKTKSKYFIQMANIYRSKSGNNIIEYVDSYNIERDLMGNDETEYIGDI